MRNLLKQLVRELVLQEMAYPASFEAEKFKAIKTFKGRVQYAKEFLAGKIGAGSARGVFIIDEEKVLKVALNAKGLAQNITEIDIGYGASSYPIAKVFESSPDGTWLEMERAKKATPTKFKQLMGVPIDIFSKYLWYWQADHKGKKYVGGVGWKQHEVYLELLKNELFNEITDLVADYDMPVGDLGRLSSWGIVTRDGVEQLVLIDFGLTSNVHSEYYS